MVVIDCSGRNGFLPSEPCSELRIALEKGEPCLVKEKFRKRILFVINSLAGGGAERVFMTLVRHSEVLREQYDILVVLLDNESEEAYPLPRWVDTVRLDCRGSLVLSVARLCRLAIASRPSLIFSFLTRANVAAVIAARMAGNPVVISERVNTTAHLAKGRLAVLSRALVRLVYPRADRIIAVSQGVGQTLVDDFGIAQDRVTVINNPIDLQMIRTMGAEPDSLGATQDDWVTMGRLVLNKNVALAIRAFAQADVPGRLIILGDGPMRDDLRSLAAASGVGARVMFAGFIANPYAVIARCRAYILPSNAEGFPNAMVEAMTLGIPVIATDCPSGPAEILDVEVDSGRPVIGRGGLLIPLGDCDAMIAAMKLMVDSGLRTRLSVAATERVKDYSVEKTITLFWEAMFDQFS